MWTSVIFTDITRRKAATFRSIALELRSYALVSDNLAKDIVDTSKGLFEHAVFPELSCLWSAQTRL